jgi:hypothetical protein
MVAVVMEVEGMVVALGLVKEVAVMVEEVREAEAMVVAVVAAMAVVAMGAKMVVAGRSLPREPGGVVVVVMAVEAKVVVAMVEAAMAAAVTAEGTEVESMVEVGMVGGARGAVEREKVLQHTRVHSTSSNPSGMQRR